MYSLVFPTVFELALAVTATVLTLGLAIGYLRRVRVERPVIGTFNGRDIIILFCFIVALPLLYVVLPQWMLTGFLLLTFVSAVSIGIRPLFGKAQVWLLLGVLVGANFWMARNLLGTVLGWQIYWTENSVLVIAAAVAISNLYVQGGMRLSHVAWFAMALGGYDAMFTLKWPVTNELAERFLGYPLDPSIGFRLGVYNASLGIGDILVYSLFLLAAYKAYGRAAAWISFAVAVVFGAVIPALSPLLFSVLIDARTDLVVPAQTTFGPVAFLAFLWFRRRYGRERTTVEFLASTDVVQPLPVPERVPPLEVPEPASA